MSALLLCEQLSRLLKPQAVIVKGDGGNEVIYIDQAISGPQFAGILSGMAGLLTTEGDRRRAHIEIERVVKKAVVTPPGVADLRAFREKAQA